MTDAQIADALNALTVQQLEDAVKVESGVLTVTDVDGKAVQW